MQVANRLLLFERLRRELDKRECHPKWFQLETTLVCLVYTTEEILLDGSVWTASRVRPAPDQLYH